MTTYFLVRNKEGEAKCLLSPIEFSLFSCILLPRYLLEGFEFESITEAQWETYNELGSLSVIPHSEVIVCTEALIS